LEVILRINIALLSSELNKIMVNLHSSFNLPQLCWLLSWCICTFGLFVIFHQFGSEIFCIGDDTSCTCVCETWENYYCTEGSDRL